MLPKILQNMEVQVQRSTIISDGGTNTPAVPVTEVPLTVFDRFASNIHIAVLFAFASPTPANDALVDGLRNTFKHFPTLTARLGYSLTHRRPCILMGGGGGGGAQVVEATVSSELCDHLPLKPSPELQRLHPSPGAGAQLFQVQFNRFKCGGLIIGFSVHHRVADGHSMGAFLTAWAKAVRGAPIDRPPVYDLSWLKPRRPPRCEFQHWGQDFIPTTPHHNVLTKNVDPSKITNILLKYPSDYLKKLKAKVDNKFTTFETLSADLWRKITIARRLQDYEHTTVRVPVNGRARLKPLVSDDFFGNLVVNAYPKGNVKVLIDGGLVKAASIIHEAIAEIDKGYFQSFIDFGELHGEEELVPAYDVDGNVLSPTLEMDSWVRFRFQEMDLGGGGELRSFLPTWVPFEGLMMFLPGLGEEGGVDVFVTLLQDHAELLRQISHSLD
ncbi:tryptamine hydroxycinnamoyltransferase 1-like [Typha latifolia]|uniref:tryptamine hydroxycinnamoyltransferase 1-like n=1 Tax=Typha latifolia TaxID=4733 RepID=UPI003C2AFA11